MGFVPSLQVGDLGPGQESLRGYLKAQSGLALTTGPLKILRCLEDCGFTLSGTDFPKEISCFRKGPSLWPRLELFVLLDGITCKRVSITSRSKTCLLG